MLIALENKPAKEYTRLHIQEYAGSWRPALVFARLESVPKLEQVPFQPQRSSSFYHTNDHVL